MRRPMTIWLFLAFYPCSLLSAIVVVQAKEDDLSTNNNNHNHKNHTSSLLRGAAVLNADVVQEEGIQGIDIDDAQSLFGVGGGRNDENDPHEFSNWHRSIYVGGSVETVFKPNNTLSPDALAEVATERFQTEDFHSGLQQVITMVNTARDEGKRIRAYGSKWTLNNLVYSNELLIETWGLNYCKVGISNLTHVAAGYQTKASHLAFVQAGVMIQPLHQALFEHGLALSTTGAGDGQRIGGAISTGTHGSAVHYGATQEWVRALHIVIPGEHVLIQRASDPVVTAAYATDVLQGARLINDDAMFNAAVVSFGSFGVIHGLILEAEPLYKLRGYVKQMGFKDVEPALKALDISTLGFDQVSEHLPFHFEAAVNTYRRGRSKSGVFVRVFEKVPLSAEEIKAITDHARISGGGFSFDKPDIDFLAALGGGMGPLIAFGNAMKKVVYGAGLQIPLRMFFAPRKTKGVVKYPFEFFTFRGVERPSTYSPLPGLGMEMAVPAANVTDALHVIFGVVDKDPIASGLAVRFVKKSPATMAFTHFGDVTATIELSAPYDKRYFRRSGLITDKIVDAMAASGIPHTYHWGQKLPVNNQWVRNAFGSELDDWMAQRQLLLGDVGCEIFANDMLINLGMYTPK